jgi:DHA1 family tetracycline resistance protein-like MFS transporter
MTQSVPTAPDTRPARSGNQLPLILVTVFLNIMGLGLILPVLPFYATAYGADGAQVGLLFTAFSGLQFLASPVFGALSDRYGRRPIILFGLLGQVLAYLLMGFATSLGMLFVSRLFAGATAGNISATSAYVADITRPEERTRAYGLVGAAFGAGLLFGPAIGGGLSLIDSRAPAFGAAILLAVNLLFGFLMLSESLPRDRRSTRPLADQLNPVGVLVPLIRRRPLRGPLMATFLLNVALTGFQANFAVFAGTRFGFGPTEVSAIFVATGLANILVQLVLVPRLSRRFSDSALVLTGAAADAAGNIATALAAAPTMLWGSLPVMTGGYSLSRGPLTSLVTKLVAPYEQGLANGGIQATISLAGVVGPLWAGFAFEILGQPAPYWTSGLLVVLAMLAIVLRTRPVAVMAPAPQGPSAYAQVDHPLSRERTVTLATANLQAEPTLQGSLANLGLVPLLNFLRTSQRAGCLNLTRNGWTGTLCLDGGRLVAASFGREHGPAALDAILLTLSEATFTFVDDLSGAEDIGGLAVDVDSLAARPSVPARQRELAAAIPTPAAVPRIVPPTTEDRHDPTELVLRLGTLQTLLAVDGARTVEELGDHSSAEVLFDLAVLMDLGLISFDVQPSRSVQLVS